MNLVLFDLDNTLLAGDSDFAWAQFLIGKGVLDREVQESKNVQFYEQYKAGTLDIFEFLDFQLAPLARRTKSLRRLRSIISLSICLLYWLSLSPWIESSSVQLTVGLRTNRTTLDSRPPGVVSSLLISSQTVCA